MKKILSLLLLAAVGICTGWAQYVIYPVPQSITKGAGKISAAGEKGWRAVFDSGIDDATRQRFADIMTEAGLGEQQADGTAADGVTTYYIGINGSGEAADAMVDQLGLERDVFTKSEKYDRHLVAVSTAGVVVVGENTDAAFFGLASLEQMLEQRDADGSLAATVIYDYADQQSRGLVEGYYGYPYSIDVKKDLMRFMMRCKMNTYLYGAKSDPYHSDNWKDAYPTSITETQKQNGWLSQAMVKEIAEESHATKVNFIWAIHPGNNFINSSSVVTDIMSKYEKMYSLGVRQFAVFVDDVAVPSTDAEFKTNADRLTALQQAIEAKWNKEGAEPADTVKPVHFVPQIYATSWVSADTRKRFYEALGKTPQNVVIYTTGSAVWTVPNNTDLATPRNELGRSVAWWWNYPCNDNADQQIFPMNMYENFYDMPSVSSSATLPSSLNNGLGIVSNPMQEGEVSKTALFSVADYAWNNSGFAQLDSWKAAFEHIVKDKTVAAAYRDLCPFIRWNDPAELNTLISAFKTSLTAGKPNATTLRAYIQQIYDNVKLVQTLETSDEESDRLLYHDLRPWLNKLESMTSATLALLDVCTSEGGDERWEDYLAQLPTIDGLDTDEAYKVTALEGMGSGISVSTHNAKAAERYFRPFVDVMKERALENFFDTTGENANAVGITNVDGVSVKVSTAANGLVSTVVSPAVTLPVDGYVGVMLAKPSLLTAVAVNDTLVAQNTVLYSANGKTWKRMTDGTAVPEDFVRYVIVLNDTDAPKSLRLIYNSMRVTIPVEAKISTTITIPDATLYDNHGAAYLNDGDYTTYTCINRNQQSGDSYQLEFSTAQTVYEVRICMGTTNQDYPTRALVQVSPNGTNWTTLKVKNGSVSYFDMSLPQVKKYSDEMSYLDFTCSGVLAKYVRLYVNSPNTSKWLRLYEIEVNRNTFECQNFMHPLTNNDGEPVSEATDGKAYTHIDSELSPSLTYNFLHATALSGVQIYADPTDMPEVSVSVSEDNGETWVEKGTMSGAIHRVDLTDMPFATTMKLTWSRAMSAPKIYEIIEVESTDVPFVIDGIYQILAPATALDANVPTALYDLQGRRVYQPRKGQIYLTNGKKVLY